MTCTPPPPPPPPHHDSIYNIISRGVSEFPSNSFLCVQHTIVHTDFKGVNIFGLNPQNTETFYLLHYKMKQGVKYLISGFVLGICASILALHLHSKLQSHQQEQEQRQLQQQQLQQQQQQGNDVISNRQPEKKRTETLTPTIGTLDGKKNESSKLDPLSEIFYGTQQNERYVYKWSHYLPMYHRHFKKFRGKAINLLEIGLLGGGSLKMWRKYFGNKANIYGVDIGPQTKK